MIDQLADLLPEKNIHPFVFKPNKPDNGLSDYEQEKNTALKKFLDPNMDYLTCPAKLVYSIPETHVLTAF